jgi:hypothetical protein
MKIKITAVQIKINIRVISKPGQLEITNGNCSKSTCRERRHASACRDALLLRQSKRVIVHIPPRHQRKPARICERDPSWIEVAPSYPEAGAT